MRSNLPTRLGKEPLVECLFEVRFASPPPSLAAVLPGFLMSAIPQIDRTVLALTPSFIPRQLRDIDPYLRSLALCRLEYGEHFINIGDRMLVIGCKLPYSGWSSFRRTIVDVCSVVTNSGLVRVIDQCSIRCVDLFEDDVTDNDLNSLNVSLTVANREVRRETTMINTRWEEDGLSHEIQIQNATKVCVASRGNAKGAMVNVLTTYDLDYLAASEFAARLAKIADRVHAANRNVFYGVLTEHMVAKLDPIYE